MRPHAPVPRASRSRWKRPAAGQHVQLTLDFDGPLAAERRVAKEPDRESPASEFALRFAALLEADPTARFDNPAISDLAREVFGSSAGHARDIYDAVEAGFNVYLSRLDLDISSPSEAISRLLSEQSRLPLQSRRDQTQIDFQQFSTPPAEAFIVGKAASICAGMHVLEPSAGTGNLALWARLAGAEVHVNEVDPRRRDLLSLQGYEPTAFDAERFDNLLAPEKTFHAVVMNPPFSATGGRVNGHRTAFGARHIEQALLRLKPGGRLVAIVGRGMAPHRPAFRDWWAGIAKRYHVRANVGMDGREYAKFGTTFDHQIIVIDQVGRLRISRPSSRGAASRFMQRTRPFASFQKKMFLGEFARRTRTQAATGLRGPPSGLPKPSHVGSSATAEEQLPRYESAPRRVGERAGAMTSLLKSEPQKLPAKHAPKTD